MLKKKVAIIGTVGLPANYGGFETMVKYLTEEKNKDIDFTVFCQKTSKENRLKEYNGSKLIYLPFFANGLQSIIYDIVAMIISWKKFDTLIILGTPGCIVLPLLKKFGKAKIIVNFGGLEWARDKWGTLGKKYLKMTEHIAVKNADIMVADNQYFCNYLKKTYGIKSELIEYGGSHTKPVQITDELKVKYPFLNKQFDVSVSRAQIDNNLHMLLETYSRVPERNLVLISNYDTFEYGRQIKKRFNGFQNLFLQDAVYNLTELDAIRSNAQIYVHSQSFCGTAPSLVEAMNLGLPIIAFDVLTNRFTTEDKALYFKNKDELLNILKEWNNEKRSDLSRDMTEISQRRYTWELISQKYADLF